MSHDPPIPLETDRLNAKKLVAIAAVSIAIGAVAVLTSSELLSHETRPLRASAAPSAAPPVLAGIRQTLVAKDDDGIRRRRDQRAALERWGWADRDAGIARIPIDRAMRIVEERARAGNAAADGGAP